MAFRTSSSLARKSSVTALAAFARTADVSFIKKVTEPHMERLGSFVSTLNFLTIGKSFANALQ